MANSIISITDDITSNVSIITVTDKGPSGPAGPIAPIKLSVTMDGLLGPSQTLLRFIVSDPFTVDPTKCASSSELSAAANATFQVMQNSSNVGSFTYGAASNVATMSLANTHFPANSVLTIKAPVSQDTTLASVGILIYGNPS